MARDSGEWTESTHLQPAAARIRDAWWRRSVFGTWPRLHDYVMIWGRLPLIPTYRDNFHESCSDNIDYSNSELRSHWQVPDPPESAINFPMVCTP